MYCMAIAAPIGLGQFDQIDIGPESVEHMGVVELEPVEIELDRVPVVGVQQIGKVVGELLRGQVRAYAWIVLGWSPLSLRCCRRLL